MRGDEALQEAELLLGANELAGAVSRAYYAMAAGEVQAAKTFVAAVRGILVVEGWT